MRLRAAVVGTGFGLAVHVPGLRAAGFEVTAVCAASMREAEDAARRASIPFATADVREVARHSDVDLVCVSSPPALHRAHVVTAIQAGKHVLCEKPFALSSSEAREMLAAAREAGVVHAVDHEFRWLPDRRALRDLIVAGEIGALRHVEITDVSPWRRDPQKPIPTWWSRREEAGGILGASGSHWIDALMWWCGARVVEVSARLLTHHAVRRTGSGASMTVTADDVASLELQLASGTTAALYLSAVAPTALRRVFVLGDRAAAVIEGHGLSGTLRLLGDSRSQVLVRVGEDAAVAGGDPIFPGYVLAAFRDLAAAVATRMRGDGEIAYPTFEDGLRVQEVMDSAHASHDAGTRVRLPGSGSMTDAGTLGGGQ